MAVWRSLIGAALLAATAGAQSSECFSKRDAETCRVAKDAERDESCVWCVAGAVPSTCVPVSLSKKLPPGVFQCDKPPAMDAFAAELAYEEAKERSQNGGFGGFGANELMREHGALSPELTAIMNQAPVLFERWAEDNGRSYASDAEKSLRFANFRETLQTVAAHELRGDSPSYRLELNKFADVSWEEFKAMYLGAYTSSQNCSATHGPGQLWDFFAETSTETMTSSHAARVMQAVHAPLPAALDWREKGAVSPVKDQGKCGSCWTFSTTGCLESHHFLRTGEMVLLSEQQLVDCAQAFDNHGCNGGLPSHAFEYVRYNGGLDTETAYPYHAVDESCNFNSGGVGATVRAAVNITYQDEYELGVAVGAVGPVSIAFQVTSDFKSYAGGVYDNPTCGTQPDEVNHAVLAVGYGKEDGKDYWIVKNSWGEDWALGGYFHMARGKNMCGLSDCASFPAV